MSYSSRTVSGSFGGSGNISRQPVITDSGHRGADSSESRRITDTYNSDIGDSALAEFESNSNRKSLYGLLAVLGSVLGAKGIPALISAFKNRTGSTPNDVILKSLYGDAYTPAISNGSSIYNNLGDLFKGFSSQLGSGLLGIGTELGSSILNYQNQVKLIDKQNAYNTPKAQMERFAEAGLNPNLVYGLGTNGNQPASGSVAPVDFTTAQRENRLAQMQIATQTKLADADIAEKMSNVKLREQQAGQVALQSAYQQLVNNNYVRDLNSQINQRVQQTENLKQELKRLKAETQTAETRSRIAVIEEQITQNEKEISDKRKEYNEADIITSIIGNIVHVGLGANIGYSRGFSTVRRAPDVAGK